MLLAIALAALLLHASPLAPLWHDELYTLDTFVPQGPAGFLTDYHVPNNHLFYTLLLWAWERMVGEDPVRLRLLGLLLTLCALPALFLAGRAIAGARAGALAALVLGCSQVAGNFATQLRGYGLSITLIAVCLAGAALWCKSGLRDRHALSAYGLSGALALWTVPSNLVFVAVVGLWAMLLARPWRQPALLVHMAWLALPLLGLLGYLPVRADLEHWASFELWGEYSGFLAVLGHDLLLGDLPWLAPVVLVLAVGARRWPVPRAAWLLLLACALTLLAPLAGPVPWPRNYVPLLAPLALVGGLLLDVIAARAPGGVASVLVLPLATLLSRPLLAPAPDIDAAADAEARPGELMSPYYLRDDYRPAVALRPLLDERLPPRSVLLARNTVSLELRSQFRALEQTHRVCEMVFAADMSSFRLRCVEPPRGDLHATRLVVVARSAEDARLLATSFASVDPSFAGLPLEAMPGPDAYHRLWTTAPP